MMMPRGVIAQVAIQSVVHVGLIAIIVLFSTSSVGGLFNNQENVMGLRFAN